jgi:hypothetical protein
VAQSRRISLQDSGISCSSVLVVPLLIVELFGAGGDGEERSGEHGQGDVAVLGVVTADLVVV